MSLGMGAKPDSEGPCSVTRHICIGIQLVQVDQECRGRDPIKLQGSPPRSLSEALRDRIGQVYEIPQQLR